MEIIHENFHDSGNIHTQLTFCFNKNCRKISPRSAIFYSSQKNVTSPKYQLL